MFKTCFVVMQGDTFTFLQNYYSTYSATTTHSHWGAKWTTAVLSIPLCKVLSIPSAQYTASTCTTVVPPHVWTGVSGHYDRVCGARLTNTFMTPARAPLSSLSLQSGFNLEFALIPGYIEGRSISHCTLLAPQSGALRISAYRDFLPNPTTLSI